jgi:hypothetical protein
MNKQFLKDALGWGFILWLIGYALGFAFFAFVPAGMIGWVIMPIGTIITIFVAWKKIKGTTLGYYLGVAAIWTIIAVVFDYFFLVKVLKPADGYYKFDVYVYYALTFIIPFVIGLLKTRKKSVSA